jgi:hypothetical protein
VGYDLDFAPEVRRWLAALEADQPGIAQQVNEALDTLKGKGGQAGPPLVVAVGYQRRQREVAPELERTYQRQLRALTRLRREVADVATLRERLEAPLDDDGVPDDQRGRLRSALDGIRAQEERLTEVSKRVDADMQAYRARKETLRASLTEAIIDGLTMLADIADVIGATDLEQSAGQLMELRPGAPKDIVARLLFTVEPGQPTQVIAAAAERDVLAAWYDRVVPEGYAAGSEPRAAAASGGSRRRH